MYWSDLNVVVCIFLVLFLLLMQLYDLFFLFSSNLFCTISLSVFVYQEYRAASHLMKYFQKLSDCLECFKHSFHRSLAIIARTVNHRRPCSFTCTFPQSLALANLLVIFFLFVFIVSLCSISQFLIPLTTGKFIEYTAQTKMFTKKNCVINKKKKQLNAILKGSTSLFITNTVFFLHMRNALWTRLLMIIRRAHLTCNSNSSNNKFSIL